MRRWLFTPLAMSLVGLAAGVSGPETRAAEPATPGGRNTGGVIRVDLLMPQQQRLRIHLCRSRVSQSAWAPGLLTMAELL